MAKLTTVIIDSYRGSRRLEHMKSQPGALKPLPNKHTVLDWTLESYRELSPGKIFYLGGYHIEKVVQAYPTLQFYYHPSWSTHQELGGLYDVLSRTRGDVIIQRGDVLTRPQALKLLKSGRGGFRAGVVHRRTPFFPRAIGGELVAGKLKNIRRNPDGERMITFSGILFIRPAAKKHVLSALREMEKGNKTLSFFNLFQYLGRQGIHPEAVDITDGWTAVDDGLSVSRFVFGTKAQTLDRLRNLVRRSTILPQVRFKSRDWRESPGRIIRKIRGSFRGKRVVIRSSALSEDRFSESKAGYFDSVLNVAVDNKEELISGIEKVIRSYRRKKDLDPHNEIFIQEYLEDSQISGVLFTRDIETGAPYYIVNYDPAGKTDTVTSGRGESLKTVICYKNGGIPSDPKIKKLIEAANELETLMNYDSLDIEFAVGKNRSVYIFQVRPITAYHNRFSLADEDMHEEVKAMTRFGKFFFSRRKDIPGKTSFLGNMTDWNPAEMIGTSPRPLALSLYQTLITDSVWARARAEMGYEDLSATPLLYAPGGRPYIDLRASLNSFLPSGLPDALKRKLIDYQLEQVRKNPGYHDKVEFEITMNCRLPSPGETARRLEQAGLTQREQNVFLERLTDLTNRIISGQTAPVELQLSRLERLAARREETRSLSVTSVDALAARIIRSLQDCRELGTLPFSILARYSFISMLYLKEFVRQGVFTEAEYGNILRSIPTVAGEISEAFQLLNGGRYPAARFIERFGHLRPGSYDILSQNYATRFKNLARGKKTKPVKPARSPGKKKTSSVEKIFLKKQREINRILEREGLDFGAEVLLDFIKKGIPGREYGKFEFTKNLDMVLEDVATLGHKLGYSREEMSFVPIEEIVRLATNPGGESIVSQMGRRIRFFRKRHMITYALRLPDIILDLSELKSFEDIETQPNFITVRKVTGEPMMVESSSTAVNLDGKIILIETADPGYDWIFSNDIKGLVTLYGGVASHMAIRAAEFGVPAAIGCGEKLFKLASRSRILELDCESGHVRRIQ